MAIEIVRRDGLERGETVARWTPSEGFIEGDLPFTDDPAYAEYDEAQLIAEFDGPTLFAVPARATQKSLSDGEL